MEDGCADASVCAGDDDGRLWGHCVGLVDVRVVMDYCLDGWIMICKKVVTLEIAGKPSKSAGFSPLHFWCEHFKTLK